MNIDDFINSLYNTIDNHETDIQHRNDCIKQIYSDCFKISCIYFDSKKEKLYSHKSSPGEDMNWNLKVIYEFTSNLIHHYENNPDEEYLHRDLKPIMRSSGASAEVINEILSHIPKELHEESRRILQQCDQKNSEIDDYSFEIHRAIKKVIVDFFPQTYNLPSRGLRELDSELFWLKDEIVNVFINWLDE